MKIDNYYVQIFIVIILTLISSYTLFGSYFYIIDDHQIITNLKNYKFEDSINQRYQPGFYFLKMLEISMFETNPNSYYILRVIGLVVFNITIFYFVSLYSKLIGLIFIVYQLLQGYWLQIFGRIGPAEFYAAVACSLFLIVTLKFYKKENSLNLACAGILSIIAFTLKENFVFIPFIFFYAILFSWKKFCFFNKVIATILIVLNLFLLTQYFKEISSIEIDIYSNTINIWERVIFFLSNDFLNVLFSFLPHFLILTLYIYKSKTNNNLNIHFIIFGVFAFLICLFQYYFYNGKLFSRYLFPYQIIYETSLVILSLMCFLELGTIKRYFVNLYENNKNLLIFSVVIVAIPLILNGHLKKNIYNYRSQTLTFKSNLTSIQNMTVKNPHLDLVFLAGSPGSIEPVHSVKMFLEHMSITNKFFLRYIGPNPKKFNKKSLEYKLSKSLISYSSGMYIEKGWSKGEFSKDCVFIHFDSIDKVKSFDANRCFVGPVMRPLKNK